MINKIKINDAYLQIQATPNIITELS